MIRLTASAAATWEDDFPPENDPQHGDFLEAYSAFLRYRLIAIPRPSPSQMNELDRPRPAGTFEALAAQPEYITNGKLMDFQLEGVSWLVRRHSCA